MLIRNWRIRIQSDGRPAITFPKGRQEVVLLPEAGDIELSDEGLIFSISRRGTTRYECPFNELGYTAPPTPIAQLQAMRCISTDIPTGKYPSYFYMSLSVVWLQKLHHTSSKNSLLICMI